MHEIKIFKPDSTGALKLVEIKEAVFDSGVTPLRFSFPKKKSITIVCEVCGVEARTQVRNKTTCKKRSCEIKVIDKKIQILEKIDPKRRRDGNPTSSD